MEMQISSFPDSILLSQSILVTEEEILDPSFQKIIDDMIETSQRRNALGLAAPQVGIPKRLFVMRRGKLSDEFDVFINPKIILKKDRVTHHGEACLSVPGKSFGVPRFKNIVVDALDRNGKPFIFKTHTKITAFAIQHEIDHLDGILIAEKGREEV
jgi:peptide deformylase